jgi:hypothetical protein
MELIGSDGLEKGPQGHDILMIFHGENIGKREKLSVDRGAIYAVGVCHAHAAICMSVRVCVCESSGAC